MWHHLYIDDPNEAYITSKKMMEATMAALMASGDNDTALFSRLDIQTGGVNYYFTPSAASVARMFGAKPCDKPTWAVAGGLLVGDQGIFERAFPGQERPSR
ncbi:MAG: hypothetical protein IT500_11905 [Rubrivivax sp.]|nr:hypothetical protein [Rubrivivax sp.]